MLVCQADFVNERAEGQMAFPEVRKVCIVLPKEVLDQYIFECFYSVLLE